MIYEIHDVFSADINGLHYNDENTFNNVKKAIENLEEYFTFDINDLRSTIVIQGKLYEEINKIFTKDIPYNMLVEKAIENLKEDKMLFNEIHDIEFKLDI
jgi:hypothetical protein